MIAASPVDAKHYFQLRNCNNVDGPVKFYVFNPNDSVDVVPYMTFSIPHGATEQGKCKSDKDKPFCKVEVADQDNEQFSRLQLGNSLWILGRLSIVSRPV